MPVGGGPRHRQRSSQETPARQSTDISGEAVSGSTDGGLADEIDAARAEAVKGLRAYGYSWAETGSRLGITRQAAQQRWG